jgi:hypothetical protein
VLQDANEEALMASMSSEDRKKYKLKKKKVELPSTFSPVFEELTFEVGSASSSCIHILGLHCSTEQPVCINVLSPI